MAWRRTKYQRSDPHQSYLRTSLDGPGVVFVAFIWPDSYNCCSEVQILRYKHNYLESWQNKNRQCWSSQLRPSNDLLLTMLQSINDWMKRSKGIADVMRHCSRRKDCKSNFRNLFEKRKNVQREWKKMAACANEAKIRTDDKVLVITFGSLNPFYIKLDWFILANTVE